MTTTKCKGSSKRMSVKWVYVLWIIVDHNAHWGGSENYTFHLLHSLPWSTYCLITDLQDYHFLGEIPFPESHYQWTGLQLNSAVNALLLRPSARAIAKVAVIGMHLEYLLVFEFGGLSLGQCCCLGQCKYVSDAISFNNYFFRKFEVNWKFVVYGKVKFRSNDLECFTTSQKLIDGQFGG